MAYVTLHPDDLIASADIDYVFKLRLDLAEYILLADESKFDSCAALHKLRRLDQRLSELSSPEARPVSLDYVHRLEILHCLESEKIHKLITYEDVHLFITTVQIAFDIFVRWHPLDRHEEADKILAVAAKMCLARTSLDALCRLDVKTDTTAELLSTIRKYFPSPEPPVKSPSTVQLGEPNLRKSAANYTSPVNADFQPLEHTRGAARLRMFPPEQESPLYSQVSGVAVKSTFAAPEEPHFSYGKAPLAQRFFKSTIRRMSPKVLDPHSSKTSDASSATTILSTFSVYAGDLWTSNAHWKKNFYLGMLVWTRCDAARLLLVDPIFTPAHCRKFGGAGSYYKTSVNGRDIDGIRLSTNRWISLLEAKAAFARHSRFTKLECTRKVTDFEKADYCLFLPCLDRSSLAMICWQQRVAAFPPRALIPRCAIPTRAPSLPLVYSSSARPSPLLRLVKIQEIVNSRIYRGCEDRS
jgi:hypothetical protein